MKSRVLLLLSLLYSTPLITLCTETNEKHEDSETEELMKKMTDNMEAAFNKKPKFKLSPEDEAAFEALDINMDHFTEADRQEPESVKPPQYGTDPTSWPGHLKPLGSKSSNKIAVIADGTLTATSFVNKYTSKGKPLHMKGAFSASPALQSWTVEYLSNAPPALMTNVSIYNLNTMELRKQSLRSYMKSAESFNWFIMNQIPAFLHKDVVFPDCLKCNHLLNKLTTHMMMLYRSQVTEEPFQVNLDRLVCPITAGSSFVLIEGSSWEKFLAGSPNAEINFQSIDYTQTPALINVTIYPIPDLQTGDCLYVPATWYLQSSYLKSPAMTVVYNWKPSAETTSQSKCGSHAAEPVHIGSYNQYFTMIPASRNSDKDALLHYFMFYLGESLSSSFTLTQFTRKVKRDGKLLTNLVNWTEECDQITTELFEVLDINSDGKFNDQDGLLYTEERRDELVSQLTDRLQDFGSLMADQQRQPIRSQQNQPIKSQAGSAESSKQKKKAAEPDDEDMSADLKKEFQQEMDVMMKDLEQQMLNEKDQEQPVKGHKKSKKSNRKSSPPVEESSAPVDEEIETRSERRAREKRLKAAREGSAYKKTSSKSDKSASENFHTVEDVEQEILAEDEEVSESVKSKSDEPVGQFNKEKSENLKQKDEQYDGKRQEKNNQSSQQHTQQHSKQHAEKQHENHSKQEL